MGADGKLYGLDLFGNQVVRKPKGVVAKRFGFSPFSVLDAKQGEWQARKRAWLSMGITGEVGRSAKSYNCHDWMNDKADGQRGKGDGTSIFDPVLCECMYRWFCQKNGQVVDPFAGGSVRGIVAATLERKYWGCDLRIEQIDANKAQAIDIGVDPSPEWVCGDSVEMLDKSPQADFIFSCPPYGDLEKYSDDPKDLSAMNWDGFLSAYAKIIRRSVNALKQDRFACFVVGDFRDKKGFYRDFVSKTIRAFEYAGAGLYNEAILATSVGSACMRVTKQFKSGRKLAKTHQNVLVFCKGDWKKATQAINESEV